MHQSLETPKIQESFAQHSIETPETDTLSEPQPVSLTVRSCNQPEVLERYFDAWQDLADHALESNVFYRPWMLLPAIWEFAPDKTWTVLLIVDENDRETDRPKLYGLIPLNYERAFKRLPIGIYRMWHHPHCFLHTPLIRAGHAQECFRAMFDWLRTSQPRAELLELNRIRGDGPFYDALQTWVTTRGLTAFENESYERALLVPAASADDYLSNTLSTGNLKELRRQRRRLGEKGELDLVVLERDEDIQPWLDEFCRLEAAGWKGENGTAFANRDGELQYFRHITSAAHKHQTLMMLKLVLDGTPIAVKCNFLCGDGSYAFKIAYDESHSKFSPGVQLELDNIRQVHNVPNIQWMDSCADARHFMINRLWGQRRTIRSLLFPTRGLTGKLLLKLIPGARWVRQKWHTLQPKREKPS